MDQDLINKNIVNALSILNKAIMGLQERVSIMAMADPHWTHIADLTRLDLAVLDDLQGNLDRLKNRL